MGAITSVCC